MFYYLCRDGFDGFWHDQTFLTRALTVVVILAGALAHKYGSFRDKVALFRVVDEEEANLTDVTVG